MRRWWSGLSQQTVNLSPSGFVGSNPTRRTKFDLNSIWEYYKYGLDFLTFFKIKFYENIYFVFICCFISLYIYNKSSLRSIFVNTIGRPLDFY